MAIKAFELFGTIDLQTGKLQTGLKTASSQLKTFEGQVKSSVKNVEDELGRMGRFKAGFNQGFMSSFGIQGGGNFGSLAGNAAGNLLISGAKALYGHVTDAMQ